MPRDRRGSHFLRRPGSSMFAALPDSHRGSVADDTACLPDQWIRDGLRRRHTSQTLAAANIIAMLVLSDEIQSGGIVMKLFPLFGTIALLGISAAAGAAAPEAQVMAPIRLFIDSFNKGDMQAAAAALSPGGLAIIDDVSPHVWAGPNASETWSKAL